MKCNEIFEECSPLWILNSYQLKDTLRHHPALTILYLSHPSHLYHLLDSLHFLLVGSRVDGEVELKDTSRRFFQVPEATTYLL